VDLARLERERERIRQTVLGRAWNPALKSYVATLDGREVDASLLLIPWYGFEEASSPRMRATFARIEAELGCGRGLYRRYKNQISPGEGAFGACSFWAAECLALDGRIDEALETFESVLALQNDLGLYAEEFDPLSGEALGNFPQAFTHVGLINAALTLERVMAGERAHGRDVPARRPAGEART
jgi:GH15 family glucan-1,4-alpha-glucosidase